MSVAGIAPTIDRVQVEIARIRIGCRKTACMQIRQCRFELGERFPETARGHLLGHVAGFNTEAHFRIFLGVRPAKSRRDCSWSITTAGAQEFLNSEVAFPHWRREHGESCTDAYLFHYTARVLWTTDPQFADAVKNLHRRGLRQVEQIGVKCRIDAAAGAFIAARPSTPGPRVAGPPRIGIPRSAAPMRRFLRSLRRSAEREWFLPSAGPSVARISC